MKYVMINTAGKTTEILAVNGDKEEWFCDPDGLQASKALLPAIDKMLDNLDMKPSDCDFFACVIGPGSFTGIRIGAVTVKTLCYALGKPAKGISYNRMLAGNRGGKVLSVVYGWADMYYVAAYEDGKETLAPSAMKKSEVEAFILKNADSLLFTDERSHTAFGGKLANERECMRLAAETGEYIDGDKLEPLYAMLSQAERELKK